MSSSPVGPLQLPSTNTFPETKTISTAESHDITEPCLSTAWCSSDQTLLSQQLVFTMCWRRAELTVVLHSTGECCDTPAGPYPRFWILTASLVTQLKIKSDCEIKFERFCNCNKSSTGTWSDCLLWHNTNNLSQTLSAWESFLFTVHWGSKWLNVPIIVNRTVLVSIKSSTNKH